jgi:FkbM family methyltransferase
VTNPIKASLKRVVVGTPIEPLARKAWKGRVYLSARRRKGLRYDNQTVEVMERVLKSDSSAVDVGCHMGVILKDMLRLAPDGTHLAFEPLPDFYQGLLKEFADAPVTIYPYALAEANGESTFEYVVNRPAYSGLRRRPYPDGAQEKVEQITVEMRRLDDLVAPDQTVQLIKIDVEGGELGVLAGATELIRRSQPVVIFEHGKAAAASYSATSEQVYDLIASCGLDIYLMPAWLHGGAPLHRAAFLSALETEYYFLAAPKG